MKKIILSCLFVLLAAQNLCAIDDDLYFTKEPGDNTLKTANGRYWNTLDVQKKALYLLGFYEGAWEIACGLTLKYTASKVTESGAIDEATSQKISDNFSARLPIASFPEVIVLIDNFYKNPLNLPLPIRSTIGIIAFERNNKTDKAEDDRLINKIREYYSQK
jgi:hypothetical protein